MQQLMKQAAKLQQAAQVAQAELAEARCRVRPVAGW